MSNLTKLKYNHSQTVLDKGDPTKVLFYLEENDNQSPISENPKGVCPSSEDSVYLGQAVNDILFGRDTASTSSINASKGALESLLVEVGKRSPTMGIREWEYKAGWRIHKWRLTSCPLDPTEEIDESNWMEKGYFKRKNDESNIDLDASSGITLGTGS